MVKIQKFIDENNFDFITVDGVIDYYKSYYNKNNCNDNDYSYICDKCEKELILITK
ncbi:hypothetical protein [Clostridium butyricum]|uniref:hypothetical protein n=1 Tax=Clostridium butyricum TaxID=1492 RepID=UPI003465C539